MGEEQKTTIPRSFRTWIKQQQERTDDIGAYARLIAADPAWPVGKPSIDQTLYLRDHYYQVGDFISDRGDVSQKTQVPNYRQVEIGMSLAGSEWELVQARQLIEKLATGPLLQYKCEECGRQVTLPIVLTARLRDMTTWIEVCIDCFNGMEHWLAEKRQIQINAESLTRPGVIRWLRQNRYMKQRSKRAQQVQREHTPS
ncbi:MAG TPA: hypothetical protein VFV38_08850 [Ktedonobacteraceae bacterium]|nr:hypothetical protein [Ktedonobacteraceae bacterium]